MEVVQKNIEEYFWFYNKKEYTKAIKNKNHKKFFKLVKQDFNASYLYLKKQLEIAKTSDEDFCFSNGIEPEALEDVILYGYAPKSKKTLTKLNRVLKINKKELDNYEAEVMTFIREKIIKTIVDENGLEEFNPIFIKGCFNLKEKPELTENEKLKQLTYAWVDYMEEKMFDDIIPYTSSASTLNEAFIWSTLRNIAGITYADLDSTEFSKEQVTKLEYTGYTGEKLTLDKEAYFKYLKSELIKDDENSVFKYLDIFVDYYVLHISGLPIRKKTAKSWLFNSLYNSVLDTAPNKKHVLCAMKVVNR